MKCNVGSLLHQLPLNGEAFAISSLSLQLCSPFRRKVLSLIHWAWGGTSFDFLSPGDPADFETFESIRQK